MTRTDCRHPSNAEIYAPPQNWEVACAIAQLRAGVALTEGQKVLLERAREEA
ncbi:MAG: hypothetical protein ABF443_14210 [Acetobacter malorum]|uniref:hypothetical protein n=1 Tax=Acetobacter malorum TaxID=178901 RepID=UPI0039ECB807